MAPLVAVVQAVLFAYAPGAALFRLPWGDRARRSALPAEERVFWHVMVSLAVSLGTVIALGALEAYKLERLLAVDAAVVLMAFVAGRGNLRLDVG